MKKLTKRVQAGGLWFDVPSNSEYICFEFDGRVVASESSIKPLACYGWMYGNSHRCQVGFVDLEGADWRECCFYVGDQEDGEAVERREWMARGVDLFMDQFVCRGGLPARVFADKIRAGEVE